MNLSEKLLKIANLLRYIGWQDESNILIMLIKLKTIKEFDTVEDLKDFTTFTTSA